LQAEVSVINSQGGVLGHQLEVKYLDDASDPSKAVLAAKQLLGDTPKDQILFFEPASVGATTEEVLPISNKAGVLDMTLTSIPATDDVSTYPDNFATYPDSGSEDLYSYAYGMKTLVGPGAKVGVILGTDAGDQAEKSVIGGNLKTAGDTLADLESVDPTTTDYVATLQKMRDKGVKGIFVRIDTPTSYVDIMKGIQQLGWKDVKVLGGVTAVSTSVLGAIPSKVSDQFFAAGGKISTSQDSTPAVKAFQQAMAKYGEITSIQLEATYADQVRLAAWAAEQAGSNDPEKMKAALESLSTTDLPTDYLLALPQPRYSATVHNLSTAVTKGIWALLKPSQAINGQWNGQPISDE
jgi:branched-chain amino acid transport system substrate-binding protein